ILDHGFGSVNLLGGLTIISPITTTIYSMTVTNAVGSGSCSTVLVVTSPNPMYTVKDLGTLGGIESAGFGINELGLIAGSSSLPGDLISHAFKWDGNALEDLDPLGPVVLNSGLNAQGFGINLNGEVAGRSLSGTDNRFHAVVWNETTPKDL